MVLDDTFSLCAASSYTFSVVIDAGTSRRDAAAKVFRRYLWFWKAIELGEHKFGIERVFGLSWLDLIGEHNASEKYLLIVLCFPALVCCDKSCMSWRT